MKKYNIATTLILLMSCMGLSAQTEITYKRGATYLENTVPPSPEPASQVKYADIPFNHSSGMAEYEVPFYTLEGSELNIPISLHYTSGGIKLDEIAGVAGLGWTLSAGGCITRTIMDMPDEYVPSAGPFRHEMPSGSLLSDLEGMVNSNAAMNFLRDKLWNRVDASLDRYSYNICGLSGSFVIQDNGQVFQLSGDGVIINYSLAEDGSVEEFNLTGPDGTHYTLALKEMTSRDGRGIEGIDLMNGKLDYWTAPTTWHLTSMRSRSGLETASFTYSAAATWDRSVRTRSETLSATCGALPSVANKSFSFRNVVSTYETRVLTGITLNGKTVSLSYARESSSAIRSAGSPQLMNYPFRLTSISTQVAGNPDEVRRMEVNTIRDEYDGRIVLKGLSLYVGGELNNQWAFSYKGVGQTVSAGSQDWYGYYNGENEFSTDGNTGICPYEFSILGEGSYNLTNGFPNETYASYMSLTSIDNDGAVTWIIYEGNSFTTLSRAISIGVRVKIIELAGRMTVPIRYRYFTYENPYTCGPTEPSINMYCTVDMSFVSPGLSSDCNWQFTLHDTPVTLGPSIRDSRVYYGKVTEDVTDQLPLLIENQAPKVNTCRTVYKYSMDDVCPESVDRSSRFSDFCRDFYQSVSAHQLCSQRVGIQDYYNNSGPSLPPVLTRKEEYVYVDGTYMLQSSTEYEYSKLSRNSVLVDYYAVQAYRHGLLGYMELNHIFHFPIYAKGNYGKSPVKEIHVGYNPSGTDTLIVNTSYVQRMLMEEPIRVSSTDMTDGKVLRRIDYKYADNNISNETWIQELKNQHCLSAPLWKGVIYKDLLNDLHEDIFKEEFLKYGWFLILGRQRLLPKLHREHNLGLESWKEEVISRDIKGNITSLKEKGHPQTVILWGYGADLPIAFIENATLNQVQSAFGDSFVIDDAALEVVPSQMYINKIADLRNTLPNAHVTTYTYIPGIGVESVTDPSGLQTTFEYDGGRLVCIRDDAGQKIEEYEYDLLSDGKGRRHLHHRVFRSDDGQSFSEDVSWWDAYGRRIQDISVNASGTGADLVTSYESDFMLHDDVKTWLPYPVHDTGGQFQNNALVSSKNYHGSELAYLFKKYELSARERVVSEALPGYAEEHETVYETDAYNELSCYIWKNTSVMDLGLYEAGQILVDKVTDADGRVVSIYKNHAGRTIATSNGTDEPTYYIYDIYDRLRAVKVSGIAISDTLNMWRYDYDSLGRLSSKGVPGAVREFYTYDTEDRLITIQRNGVLKELEYDQMGRLVTVYQVVSDGARVSLEQHTYDTYPSCIIGENPKGLKTSSRLAVMDAEGSVSGYAEVYYSYDRKKRPVRVRTVYPDGTELIEQTQYTYSGEIDSCTYSYMYDSKVDELSVDYSYDQRGRIIQESASLSAWGGLVQSAVVEYGYDELGRLSNMTTSAADGHRLHKTFTYSLQGWTTSISVNNGECPLFSQFLGYDEADLNQGYTSLYSGLISRKEEVWNAAQPISNVCDFAYDYAGRLSKEKYGLSETLYTYDARGNILTVQDGLDMLSYTYVGDKLDECLQNSFSGQTYTEFEYDSLGRMILDGTTGQNISYNILDLIRNVALDGINLVNYSYLVDGTKLSALQDSGEGLVYRGPFVYRKSAGPGNSSLTLESAAFGGGRLTPSGAMLYVTDYLGSVRAVVDGQSGELYKASDFSTFGRESAVTVPQQGITPVTQLVTATLSDGITLREGYTGKEDQNPNFGTGYTDFGARQYNPALRRWMTPDPLSEKYYGISPYAFCNNNPVNLVDPDGRAWYYNIETGQFVAHFEDDDDLIYMITPEQIDEAKGQKDILDSFRDDYNIFVQLALEKTLDNKVASVVLLDLFERTNIKADGGQYINDSMVLLSNPELSPYAEIKGTTIVVNPQKLGKGYDIMLILAHEIGHRLEVVSKTISKDEKESERSADAFAKGHWVYEKASDYAKQILEQHENEHRY